MVWYRERRVQLFLISLTLGIIAGLLGFNQAHEDRVRHEQNQLVMVHDMKILLDNQRLIVENQKAFMRNGTLEDLRDVNTDVITNYSELKVNPITGLPS